ncbi:MAG: four helix bundle protein, partial [Acidobacteriota bacterium]
GLMSAAILRLCRSLPPGCEIGVIKRQLLRAGTSVGSNYRAAQRAKSRRDFIHKLGTVEEEADECAFWLDLLTETDLAPAEEIAPGAHASESPNRFAGILTTS